MAQTPNPLQPSCWECHGTGKITVGQLNRATGEVEIREIACPACPAGR